MPITILRLLGVGIIFWLIVDKEGNKALYGTIGIGSLAGWLLGSWDEIAFSFLYGVSSLVFPAVIAGVIILVGAIVRDRIKHLRSTKQS